MTTLQPNRRCLWCLLPKQSVSCAFIRALWRHQQENANQPSCQSSALLLTANLLKNT